MYDQVKDYLAACADFAALSPERRAVLDALAAFIRQEQAAGRPAQLTFICTHNSRRSHLSQVWAAVAAEFHRIPRVESYSGGTEATAFNPRAVAALQRAGFDITSSGDDKNPAYNVHGLGDQVLTCYSKRYDDVHNPHAEFAAVMTCSDADEKCPLVMGSIARIPLRYEDPKVADGTPQEAAKYDERCAQIARELLYALSLVKAS